MSTVGESMTRELHRAMCDVFAEPRFAAAPARDGLAALFSAAGAILAQNTTDVGVEYALMMRAHGISKGDALAAVERAYVTEERVA